MLARIVQAVVVAAVVFLACILVGALLGDLGIPIASTVGGFLTRWAAAIGVLAGLWHFFNGGFLIGGA